MRILVIGSEGNIGKPLVQYLKKELHQVFRADIIPGYKPDYVQMDINISSDLECVFRDFEPEMVFNLAATVGRGICERSPHLSIHTNVLGTNNIVQMCSDHSAKLIHFSSSEVYGNGEMSEDQITLSPKNRYGLSKVLAEKIIEYEMKNCRLKAVIVRPCMLYSEDETLGEHRSAMIHFAENLVKGRVIDVHTGSVRGWLHMSDAVRAFSELVYMTNEVINIGNPRITTIDYVAEYMCDFLKLDKKKYIKMIKQPEGMTYIKNPNLEKQKRLIKFHPSIEIEEGIERVLKRMLEYIGG